MAKPKQQIHVVELALDTTGEDNRRIEGILEAAKRLINTTLQDGLGIVDAIRNDPAWDAARKMPRGATGPQATDQQRAAHKARSEAFNAVLVAHRFSDANFQHIAIEHKNAAGFQDRIGSPIAQKQGLKTGTENRD